MSCSRASIAAWRGYLAVLPTAAEPRGPLREVTFEAESATLPVMASTDRLDGKIVLVTGAAQGVGAATARAVVDAGASVALLDVAQAPLRDLTRQLGDHAHAYAVDVTDFDAMTAAVTDLVERVGGIDAVVANAGIEVLDWAVDMREGFNNPNHAAQRYS